jgi:hypothetical protein
VLLLPEDEEEEECLRLRFDGFPAASLAASSRSRSSGGSSDASKKRGRACMPRREQGEGMGLSKAVMPHTAACAGLGTGGG